MPHLTRRPRRTALLMGVATATLGLTLTACAGSSEEAPSTGAEAAMPAEYSVAVQSPPNSLDPAQVADGTQMLVWGSVMDTLLARDRDTGELIPNAAKEWSYNDDGTVLTLTLQDGMTFSDDTPVDAEAVAASLERTRQTPGVVQAKYSQVTEIVAADEATIEIRFESHDPQFVENLALGAGAFAQPESLEGESAATDPVGSGPYTLDTEATVPGTSYVLNKREDYWNAEAIPFDTFTVQAMQDPTASLNALQSGEIDGSTVQAQLVGQLSTDEFTLSEIPATAVAVLDIVDKGGENFPALGDKRVRQAINHALDREGIVTGLFSGAGQATEQVFNPDGGVYDESLNGTYEYDPDLGRELVEEAGYAGETFEIPSTFLSTTVEPAISEAFESIGLGVEWVSVPPQQAQSAHLSGDYGLTFQIVGFNSDAGDAFYHYADGGFGNPMGYTDDTLGTVFSEIDSTVGFDAAQPAYQELNEYAVEEALTAPIAYLGSTWALRDGVTYSAVGGLPMTVRAFGAGE
ncbi:ABC transporter substrate-binding protein [Microbacterium halophytorum]|uniref:ABC transporter substrate-binding protein n=1 Tax=Microbacterium halophytorum TaxID=2067568 RepID=UPI000CFDCD65|nr:ABC transporter substrate-binding protein [Microbacterium halophytorum]